MSIVRRLIIFGLIFFFSFTIFGVTTSSAVNDVKVSKLSVSGTSVNASWSTKGKLAKTTYFVELIESQKPKEKPIKFNKVGKASLETSDLKPWTEYSIRVRAAVGSKYFAWSKYKSFATTANAPDDLSIKNVSYRSADISWNPVLGASGYRVFLNNTAVDSTVLSTYAFKGLDIGKEYSFKVLAVKGSLRGLPSEQSFTTLQTAPQNVTNTLITNTTATFEWSAISGVDDYEIYLDGKLADRVKVTNYQFKNLAPGKSFSIKILGRFGTQSTLAYETKAITASEAPSSLKLIEATTSTLKFEWVGSKNFSKYYIYQDSKQIATSTSNSYTITGLKTGQDVVVYVTGVEGEVESSPSSEVKANTQVTSPAAPTATPIDATSVRIAWVADLAAKNVIVEVFDKISSTALKTSTVVGNTTSVIISGLSADSEYTATIKIDYGTRSTDASPIVTFTTLKPSPKKPTVSLVTSSSATISWDAVSGAILYEYSIDGGVPVSTSTNLSVLLSSRSAGVSYSVRVRAGFTNSSKQTIYSEYSEAVSFTALTDPANKPTNSSVPVVSVISPTTVTTEVVGATLSTTNGAWTSVPAVSGYSYQWQRSLDGGSVYSNLNGATNKTYVLAESDYGFLIRVVVTATNVNGSTTVNSAATSAIGTIVNLQIPIARGTLVLGDTLTATQGTWHSADSLNYNYQWQRSINNSSWSDISGATAATHTLVEADLGKYVRIQITARSNLGSLTVQSPSRGDVPAILNTAIPTVSGVALLTATTGTWLNSPGSYSYQWEQSSDGALWDYISGATSSTFSLTSSQAGKYIRVQVRGTKTVGETDYSTVAYSSSSGLVSGIVISNSTAPVVSGAWTVGVSLSTSAGSWSQSGTYTYKWQESSDASTWSDISGATSSTYTLVSANSGKFIRSVVTITSSTGAGTAYSAYTRKVDSPYNTVAPAITGTIRVGETQTSTNGTWSNTPTSYTYQWQSSSNGILWTNIADSSTAATYIPTFAQANLQLRVTISAVNAVDTATVTSNVVSGFLPPEATVIPTISGTTTAGLTLTATSGTWPQTSSGYVYQWQRSTNGVSWSDISSATSSTYVLASGDAGYVIRVQVSLSTNAGTSVAYSLATTSIAAS
jgi:hypothetical protein